MNQNPYQAPNAELEQPFQVEDGPWHEARGVGAERGVAWFTEGWRLLKKAPMMFAVMGIIFIVIYFVLGLVPIVGYIASVLIWPHLMAGLYLAARHAWENQPVEIGDLFQPFNNLGSLLPLGGLYLLGSVLLVIVMMILMFAMLGAAGMGVIFTGETGDLSAFDETTFGLSVLLAMLIGLLLFIPYMMAFMFAPVLVHQQNLPSLEAIKQSFVACLRNIVPFLIWGLIWFVAMIVLVVLALIPVLGWLLFIAAVLVFVPLSCNNLYVAYRNIFLD